MVRGRVTTRKKKNKQQDDDIPQSPAKEVVISSGGNESANTARGTPSGKGLTARGRATPSPRGKGLTATGSKRLRLSPVILQAYEQLELLSWFRDNELGKRDNHAYALSKYKALYTPVSYYNGNFTCTKYF